MTWDAFHHRGDVLRSVVEEANARRDGVLPMDLPGVAETFGDETALVAALQLRWHTRLAGRIERSLMDACDPRKVHQDFPEVYDRATLATFVDSTRNLLVLCDVHHRSLEYGIHHLLTQDWAVQKYLLAGYTVAALKRDAAAVEAKDEAVVEAAAKGDAA